VLTSCVGFAGWRKSAIVHAILCLHVRHAQWCANQRSGPGSAFVAVYMFGFARLLELSYNRGMVSGQRMLPSLLSQNICLYLPSARLIHPLVLP
jgi:hypothetical protein